MQYAHELIKTIYNKVKKEKFYMKHNARLIILLDYTFMQLNFFTFDHDNTTR